MSSGHGSVEDQTDTSGSGHHVHQLNLPQSDVTVESVAVDAHSDDEEHVVDQGTAPSAHAQLGQAKLDALDHEDAQSAPVLSAKQETALKKEIVARYTAAKGEEPSDAEVALRVELVKGMKLVNDPDGDISYFGTGKGLALPKPWAEIPAFDPETGEPEPGGAFKATGAAHAAIDAIFKDGGATRLECNSAAQLVHYRALRETLGDDEFDRMFSGGDVEHSLILCPEWLSIENPKSKGKLIDPPSTAMIPKLASGDLPKSADDLIPGDWVYFVNYEDYAEKHPDGAWQGENALYMGGDTYMGFGTDVESEEEMAAMLRAEYNKGTTKKTAKSGYEDEKKGSETLSGVVPGIDKTQIRRLNPALIDHLNESYIPPEEEVAAAASS
jgi:hypothetical protein